MITSCVESVGAFFLLLGRTLQKRTMTCYLDCPEYFRVCSLDVSISTKVVKRSIFGEGLTAYVSMIRAFVMTPSKDALLGLTKAKNAIPHIEIGLVLSQSNPLLIFLYFFFSKPV